MSISDRVQIPPSLTQARSFDDIRLAAKYLSDLDTPQALPILAQLNSRLPSRIRLFFSFLVISTVVGVSMGLLIALLILGWSILISVSLKLFFQLNGSGILIWSILIIIGGIGFLSSDRVQSILDFEKQPIVDLPYLLKAMQWMGWLTTWFSTRAIFLLGLMSWLFPTLYTVTFVRGIFLWLNIVGALIIGGLLGKTLPFSDEILFLLMWWLFGSVGLLSGKGSSPEFFVIIGLSLLFPTQAVFFLANACTWTFHRWQSKLVWVIQGWKLRDNLSTIFSIHQRGNQVRIGGNGALAVCRIHLARFVRQQSGPVTFWWCPICHDDAYAYPDIHLIQGVLDIKMSDWSEQIRGALRINLRAWLNSPDSQFSLDLDEVLIGHLEDPYEVEMFITQYKTLQAQRGWPLLQKIRYVISPAAHIDEHVRRQIQYNFRS